MNDSTIDSTVSLQQIYSYLHTLTREELRKIARALNIQRGRNKNDTVANLTQAAKVGQLVLEVRGTLYAPQPEGYRKMVHNHIFPSVTIFKQNSIE